MVTVRVGIAGWGGIARTHTLALRSLPVLFPESSFSVGLAAVATRDPDRKGPAIHRAGFAGVVKDELALVEHPHVDAIDICTPNAMHADAAIAAWRKGKPVYCEKPLAESLEACERMAAVYDGLSVKPASQVALVLRFWPAVARVKDWIEAGHLGRILSFRARLVHGGYLDPSRPMSWRLDEKLSGGGALADLGIHLIDAAQFLMGPVNEVDARARTFVTERPVSPGGAPVPVRVDDWAEITCTLESGAVGTIEATRAGDGQEETTLEIFGTEGSVRISGSTPVWPQWFDRRRGESCLRRAEPGVGRYTRAVLSVCPPGRLTLGPQVDAHLGSLHWWLRRIADPAWEGTVPPVAAGIAEATSAQAVLEAAYRAAGLKG